MIDVAPMHLATILAILQRYAPDCEVRAFGSRYHWTAKDYSDLDLVMVGERKRTLAEMGALREAFAASDLPYRVDVLDWHALSPEFQEVIAQGYAVIQKAGLARGAEGWKTYNLEDILDTLIDYRGKTPRKTSHGIPLITAKIVKNGFIQQPEEFIAEEDYDGWMVRGLPKSGDVVLTTEAPLGEVAQLKDNNVALAQRIVTLRGKSGVLDNGYLKYFLRSEIGQSRLKEKETGTTVTGIKQSELRLVKIDLPPFNTQRRIADILSALDDKIELNRQTNATLEAMAQAIFKEWFVEFNLPLASTSSANGADSANGDALPEPVEGSAAAMHESALGMIPRGWRVGSILEIADLLSGGTPSTQTADYWNGQVKWVSAKDVSNAQGTFVLETERKISQAGVDNSNTKILPALTTVVTARGTVGSYCILAEPMAMNQTNYGLKTKRDGGDYFVFFSLGYLVAQLRQAAYGTIFDTVTTKTFEQSKIVIPPNLLTQQFDQQVMPIMEKILSNLQQSATLTAIRDALLPKLMSGEISV